MSNVILNGKTISNSPKMALEGLRELVASQNVAYHLREMYLAWMSSPGLELADPTSRGGYFESYDSLRLLIEQLEEKTE